METRSASVGSIYGWRGQVACIGLCLNRQHRHPLTQCRIPMTGRLGPARPAIAGCRRKAPLDVRPDLQRRRPQDGVPCVAKQPGHNPSAPGIGAASSPFRYAPTLAAAQAISERCLTGPGIPACGRPRRYHRLCWSITESVCIARGECSRPPVARRTPPEPRQGRSRLP